MTTALARVQEFYATLVDRVVPVSSPRAAELAKVFENTFAQVNIALVNEMAVVCSELGLDVDEVLDAAATKGHSIMRFRPGPGVGGHCIAVDPLYLTWMRRNHQGKAFRFAELADEINNGMPMHVVDRARCLLQRAGHPAVEGAHPRAGRGLQAERVRHPRVPGPGGRAPAAPVRRRCHGVRSARLRQSDADLAAKAAGSFDLVIMLTDHAVFDWGLVHENAEQILDTRNVYPQGADKVHKL